MAKGNMFQGMARGVVGDVVFSRLDGQQVSRVRNRNPRNPRTNAQLYQRAIMATIMQAYSYGKQIFDHSFEGYAVGAANQRKFMSDNASILRELAAVEVNANYATKDEYKAAFLAPGVKSPVGFVGMKVSEGTYQNRAFLIGSYDETSDEVYFKLPDVASAVETRAAYSERVGLLANDYYTLCGYMIDGTDRVYWNGQPGSASVSQYAGKFFFIRMRVKDTFTSDTEGVAQGATYADLFDVETSSDGMAVSTLLAKPITANVGRSDYQTVIDAEDNYYADTTFGIIRSRLDVDLRSTTYLQKANTTEILTINAADILGVWQQGTVQVGDSSLILEGGNF